MTRRYPALVLAVIAIVGVVFAVRNPVRSTVPTFSVAAGGWMPSAPPVGGLTETWFCPGVPATGHGWRRGRDRDRQPVGRTAWSAAWCWSSTSRTRSPARTRSRWRGRRRPSTWTSMLPGAIVGAVVEIDGGGGIVEQQAFDPPATASPPCANATSRSLVSRRRVHRRRQPGPDHLDQSLRADRRGQPRVRHA